MRTTNILSLVKLLILIQWNYWISADNRSDYQCNTKIYCACIFLVIM